MRSSDEAETENRRDGATVKSPALRFTRSPILIIALLFALSASAQFTLRDTTFLAALSGSHPPPPGCTFSASFQSPLAYFKFDTLNSGNAIDSVGAKNLTALDSSTTSVAGIIGNAYEMHGDTPNSTDATYELGGGVSFAIRLWIRYDVSTSAYVLDWGSSHFLLEIRRDYFAPDTVTVKLASDMNDVELDSDDTIGIDGWHRIFAYYKTGVEVGLKLDNGTTKTAVFTDTLVSGGTDLYWELWTPGSGYNRYDELAIWKGYVPTDDEMTCDWNSGAGTTYPF